MPVVYGDAFRNSVLAKSDFVSLSLLWEKPCSTLAIAHLIPSCGILFVANTRAIQDYVALVQHAQDSDFFLLLDRVICFLVFCHRLQREKTIRGLIGVFIFKEAQFCILFVAGISWQYYIFKVRTHMVMCNTGWNLVLKHLLLVIKMEAWSVINWE